MEERMKKFSLSLFLFLSFLFKLVCIIRKLKIGGFTVSVSVSVSVHLKRKRKRKKNFSVVVTLSPPPLTNFVGVISGPRFSHLARYQVVASCLFFLVSGYKLFQSWCKIFKWWVTSYTNSKSLYFSNVVIMISLDVVFFFFQVLYILLRNSLFTWRSYIWCMNFLIKNYCQIIIKNSATKNKSQER